MRYAIYKIVNNTTADINHFADTIYFQGCMDHCSFCFNPELIPYHSANMSEGEILAQLQNDWVVLTGGEPFYQFILPLLKTLRNAGKKICVLTSVMGIAYDADAVHIDLKMHRNYTNFKLPNAKVSFGVVGESVSIEKIAYLKAQLKFDSLYIKGQIDSNKRQQLLDLHINLLEPPINVVI